jgi:hypothetical protein
VAIITTRVNSVTRGREFRHKKLASSQEAEGRRRNPWGMSQPGDRDAEQFERVLLRRGVGALEADRDRCTDCGRTPLVGEHVHLHERVAGIVCELCSSLRRERPVASELVRHCERGLTVRMSRAAARAA